LVFDLGVYFQAKETIELFHETRSALIAPKIAHSLKPFDMTLGKGI
jgi:hypothetical protein